MDIPREDAASSSRHKQSTEKIKAPHDLNKCKNKKVRDMTDEEKERNRLYERERKRLQRAKLKAKKLENSDPLGLSVKRKQTAKNLKKVIQQTAGDKMKQQKKVTKEENAQNKLTEHERKQLPKTKLKAIKLESLDIMQVNSTSLSPSLTLIPLKNEDDHQTPEILDASLSVFKRRENEVMIQKEQRSVFETEDKSLHSQANLIEKNTQQNFKHRKKEEEQLYREEEEQHNHESKNLQKSHLKPLKQQETSDPSTSSIKKSSQKNRSLVMKKYRAKKLANDPEFLKKENKNRNQRRKSKFAAMTEEEKTEYRKYERERKRLQRFRKKAKTFKIPTELKETEILIKAEKISTTTGKNIEENFEIYAQSIKSEAMQKEYNTDGEEILDPLYCCEINEQASNINEKLDNFLISNESNEHDGFLNLQTNEFEELSQIQPYNEDESSNELLTPLQIQPLSTTAMQEQRKIFKTDNLKKYVFENKRKPLPSLWKKSRHEMTEEELEELRKYERERKRKQRIHAKANKLKIVIIEPSNESLIAQKEHKAELRKLKKEQMTEEEKEEIKRYERERKRIQRARLKAEKMEESFDPLEMLFVSCPNDSLINEI